MFTITLKPHRVTLIVPSGPRFNIKMSSYQYRKSHCGDKTVVRSSYLHNGISYAGKMSSLYWMRALGPVSISDKTSNRKISYSLEGARLGVKMLVSLRNLTGTSGAVLPRCLSNFRAIGQFWIQISRLRNFVRSYDKTPYRILKRGPGRDRNAHCFAWRLQNPMS